MKKPGAHARRQCVLHQERPRESGADGAEHQGTRSALSGFKRRYRKAEGVKRLKRGAAIPIAVLVPKVQLKRRLKVEYLVAGRVPRVAAAVERSIGTL